MDVTPLISSKNSVVQSYGPQGFKVSGTHYDHNILISPQNVRPWHDKEFKDLTAEDFEELAAEKPDVILIGTGATMLHLPPALRAALQDKGVNVETMDTGAACRTFNVLMSDGRNLRSVLYRL